MRDEGRWDLGPGSDLASFERRLIPMNQSLPRPAPRLSLAGGCRPPRRISDPSHVETAYGALRKRLWAPHSSKPVSRAFTSHGIRASPQFRIADVRMVVHEATRAAR